MKLQHRIAEIQCLNFNPNSHFVNRYNLAQVMKLRNSVPSAGTAENNCFLAEVSRSEAGEVRGVPEQWVWCEEVPLKLRIPVASSVFFMGQDDLTHASTYSKHTTRLFFTSLKRLVFLPELLCLSPASHVLTLRLFCVKVPYRSSVGT